MKSEPFQVPGQIMIGEAVENEASFENAQVSRFAVALYLPPFHLRQRRRVQRMVRLNEAWRVGEGHVTGVLSLARFHELL